MNATLATCLLLSLVIYHMGTSLVKASTTAYMSTTSNQCVTTMGSNIWSTEELSSIMCASLCTEDDNCKGLIYSGSLRICQFCHSYGKHLPLQALYCFVKQKVQFIYMKEVKGILTKGGSNDQYVTSYEVSYSLDCFTFTHVLDTNNHNKVFPGNNDDDTSVVNELPEPVLAMCVRLHPKAWNMLPSLRFDVIGCSF